MSSDGGDGECHPKVIRAEFLVGPDPTLHLLEVLHKGVNGVLLD